jgi:hypothetical protein
MIEVKRQLPRAMRELNAFRTLAAVAKENH